MSASCCECIQSFPVDRSGRRRFGRAAERVGDRSALSRRYRRFGGRAQKRDVSRRLSLNTRCARGVWRQASAKSRGGFRDTQRHQARRKLLGFFSGVVRPMGAGVVAAAQVHVGAIPQESPPICRERIFTCVAETLSATRKGGAAPVVES